MENKLTAMQEKFSQSMADSMTQTAAYKSAYNTKNLSEKDIWERSSRVAANYKVIARINELKALLAKKQLWTREQSVDVLKKIALSRNAFTKDSERVSAIRELNLMHGYNATSGDLDSYVLPVNVTIQVKSARAGSNSK